MIKNIVSVGLILLLFWAMPVTASAQMEVPEGFDLDGQLDALGKDELMRRIPEEAGELLQEAEVYDLSPGSLLELSPRQFFATIWNLLVRQVRKPLRVLAVMAGVILLGALLDGLGNAAWSSSLSPVFGTVSALCILTMIVAPILECVVDTARVIRDASLFMLSFVPMFSAAIMASGQPVSGATYNLFLFGTCEVVAQIISQTLLPLMSVYLALCIAGSAAPGLNISSAAAGVKSVVSWALGFLFTFFVGLLSVQTMVAQGADSVTTRAAKFLLGSFVPVVGSALSEAYTAAQGCLRLLRTSVGAYGIIAALFIFLPVLLQAVSWLLVTKAAAVAGEIMGVGRITELLKSCGSVLSILVAIIICYALLIIVSTTVILVTGLGG